MAPAPLVHVAPPDPGKKSLWVEFLEKVDNELDGVLVDRVARWFVEELGFAKPSYAASFTLDDAVKKGIPSSLEDTPTINLIAKALTIVNRRARQRAIAQRKALRVQENLRQELEIGGYLPVLTEKAAKKAVLKKEKKDKMRQQAVAEDMLLIKEENSRLKTDLEVARCLESENARLKTVLEISRVNANDEVATLQKKLADALAENNKLRCHKGDILADGHLFIRSLDGSEFSIGFRLDDTVSQLKTRLAEFLVMPLGQVGIALGHMILGEGNISLEEYGVESGSRLSVFLEPEPEKPETLKHKETPEL